MKIGNAVGIMKEENGEYNMRFQSFLIKYAEIGIKGKNRYLFEDALVKQIRRAVKQVEGTFEVSKAMGRIYVNAVSEYDYDELIEALQCVFGIVHICPVVQIPDKGFDDLSENIVRYMDEMYPDKNLTFKVECRRSRKNYPLNSQEMNRELGGRILDAFGTNGKAMLLLSGGIDSPVAGYMIAKRGVFLDATYFHAPPYTSERAKQKVVDLAKLVAKYSGPIRLHIVNFTDIQLYIYDKCPHDELTIIMRRYMMRIAEEIAKETGALGLVTGESIGQVASQTMQSLAATNEVCTMPVFRPVIGFDKQEIVEVAEKIGTFETSIQPFEDCCTIFVAKHPVTKPNVNVIRASEKKLEEKIDEMVKTAIETAEVVLCEA